MMAIVSAIRLPGHQQADRLQVEERRVVDAQPERLVGAVADGVGRSTGRAGSRPPRRPGPGAARISRGSLAMTGPSGISWRHWSMIRMLC